jgi:hypothetical protein
MKRQFGAGLESAGKPALFLSRDLLLNIAPRADLEAAAYPAKLFRSARSRVTGTNDALQRGPDPVNRQRTLRALQNLWRDYRFGLYVRFTFHGYFHYVRSSLTKTT